MDQVTVPNKLAVIGPLLSIFSTAPQHNFYDLCYDNSYDLRYDHFYDQQCLLRELHLELIIMGEPVQFTLF